MPELPEVECVRRGLQSILGTRPPSENSVGFSFAKHPRPVIERLEIRCRDLRRPIPKNMSKLTEQMEIEFIDRRGKYLLWHLSRGVLISHLGMSGSWRLAPPGDERIHDHVYIHLKGGRRLAFRDPRRFGVLLWAESGKEGEHELLCDLGPEPLDTTNFSGEALRKRIGKSVSPIKNLIMNQKVVVGVGNIYASEALFRAGIHPKTRGSRMTHPMCDRLANSIREVLTLAIDSGGSSIRDYRNADGGSGAFQTTFQVYGRDGLPCLNCSTPIRAIALQNRSTYWCPVCQRKG